MNKPTEKEIEKIKSVGHLIEYCLTNPEIKDFEIWDCVKQVEEIGKLALSNKWDEDSYNDYMNLDSMKKIMEKLFTIISENIEKTQGQNGQ